MGQFLLYQQVSEVVPDLVVTKMFRGRLVVSGQASDRADRALLGLLGEPEVVPVFDEFVFDWT